jgi:hypothetical protein
MSVIDGLSHIRRIHTNNIQQLHNQLTNMKQDDDEQQQQHNGFLPTTDQQAPLSPTISDDDVHSITASVKLEVKDDDDLDEDMLRLVRVCVCVLLSLLFID